MPKYLGTYKRIDISFLPGYNDRYLVQLIYASPKHGEGSIRLFEIRQNGEGIPQVSMYNYVYGGEEYATAAAKIMVAEDLEKEYKARLTSIMGSIHTLED